MHIPVTTYIQLTCYCGPGVGTPRVDHLKIAVLSCSNKRSRQSVPQQHVK